ncbi:MAG: DUF6531 domain-containing protein, partial [Pyrinomonadaceae bacterium]|nr:DUF6531 domain-containing protein [Pyrinomonadaceae bacterium]
MEVVVADVVMEVVMNPAMTQMKEIAQGVKLEESTDIFIEGSRGNLEITRYYSSALTQNCSDCVFGSGMRFNYGIRLQGSFEANGAGRVISPVEQVGQLFTYTRTEANGTLVFKAANRLIQLADELRKFQNGLFEYKFADGSKMEFDNQGNLTAEVDLNGNRTVLSYSNNKLIQITDPVGRFLSFQYSGNLITRITDSTNRVWQYSYNFGRLSSVTDPLGNSVSYIINGNGNLIRITDPKGNIVKNITYDIQGRVVSQQFADGGIESYVYTQSGTIITQTEITDPMGRKTIKRFNALGYVIENIDSLGQRAIIDRNLNNNLAQSTRGSCNCTEMSRQYDSNGNILSETDRVGQTSEMQYLANTNYISQLKDKTGQVYNIGYDSNGNATSFTDSQGRTTQQTFNSFGLMTSNTNALGQITSMEYDSDGNLSASIDALGNRTTFEYDAISRRTAIIDPLGRRTEVTYDANNRITSYKDTSGAITQYQYDVNDNLIKITDAIGWTWRSNYDSKNRVISSTDPLNRKIRYNFNLNDEVISVTTPKGREIKYEYNQRGEIEKLIEPNSNFINYLHDFKGNLLSIRDQRGNVTSYRYDNLYRPVSQTNPLGQTSTVTYNQLNQIAEATDVLGRRRTNNYDYLGRLLNTSFADAQISYQYDVLNRVTSINDSQSGAISWNYDAAGRVTSETSPNGVISYTYNAASEKTSMTAGNRPTVNYGYDSAGRLSSISQATEQFNYSYDVLSRMTALSRPNSVTTNYSYDTAGRLERLKHTDGSNQAIEDYQYDYTIDNEISAITSLLPATNQSQAKTYGTADAANRIRQVGTNSYNYDDLGQLISKTTAEGTTNYNWDARGRLKQAVLPSGQSVNYKYDVFDRLEKRTVGTQETKYLYDGVDVVADEKNDGSSVEYLNGMGIDDKLRQSTNTNGSLFFQTDHLGSTTALTNSSGSVVERQSYTAFGETNGSSMTRYGFTGR